MKILLADDEVELTRALKAIFVHNGYEVDIAENGKEAYNLAVSNNYDAIVLDIMMPIMDGLDVLLKLRNEKSEVPVILLTAKAEIDDRINGLDLGANDYLTKPFAVGELMARVRALIRGKEHETMFEFGNIKLNTETNELMGEGSALRISSKEAKVLEILMKNPQKEVSAQKITNEIWKTDGGELIIYISYLKNKLNALNANFYILENEGYKLEMI